jgi:DNA polymerase-1
VSPTDEQVAAAVAVIDEMMCDFPLATKPDRVHAFAMLLTLMTRHLFPLSPMFVIDGNGPGVGKNLLSECCVYVATGEWAQTDPLPLDADEQRKQITSMLSTGRTVALFDEAHTVSGVSLARLITSTTWGDRLLGYSRQVSYPNTITVIGLGNNVEVQGDLPRRCIVIRLESQDERPELRSGFRHDDLRSWVTMNRPRLVEALLTIVRSWVVAGRPNGVPRLGSFDGWAALVGGTLKHAGVDGFLSNAEQMRERSATDDGDMEGHLAEMSAFVGDTEFTVKRVVDLIKNDHLEAIPPKVSPDGGRLSQQVGHIYRRYADRWVGD